MKTTVRGHLCRTLNNQFLEFPLSSPKGDLEGVPLSFYEGMNFNSIFQLMEITSQLSPNILTHSSISSKV